MSSLTPQDLARVRQMLANLSTPTAQAKTSVVIEAHAGATSDEAEGELKGIRDLLLGVWRVQSVLLYGGGAVVMEGDRRTRLPILLIEGEIPG